MQTQYHMDKLAPVAPLSAWMARWGNNSLGGPVTKGDLALSSQNKVLEMS